MAEGYSKDLADRAMSLEDADKRWDILMEASRDGSLSNPQQFLSEENKKKYSTGKALNNYLWNYAGGLAPKGR